MLSACTLQPGRPPVAPPPSVPITLEAQNRLLQDARALLARGEPRGAARLLERLVKTYPDSGLRLETQWWLGRCYEQDGRLQEALEQYEFVAQAAGAYSEEAGRRVLALKPRLQERGLQARAANGLMLPAAALPTSHQIEPWFTQLALSGVTVIVIQVGSAEGVYFQTSLAPVVQDAVGALAAVAHRHGILVYGAFSVDRMEWVNPGLGWHDVRYDPVLGTLERSGHLDLYNPAFQEYLSVFIGDLARSGVDGLLFRSAPERLDEGFSPFGIEAFKRDFRITLDPAMLLGPADRQEKNGHGALSRSQRPQATPPLQNGRRGQANGPDLGMSASKAGGPTAVFWQWAGWKARTRAKMLERLMVAARRISPALRFTIELHQESVMEPVKALAQYGEDVLAMNQTPADVFFFRSNTMRSGNGNTHRPVSPEVTLAFLQRVRDLLGGLNRVWIVPGPVPGRRAAADGPNPSGDRMRLPAEIGVIYEQ
jgi:hypothetical protein